MKLLARADTTTDEAGICPAVKPGRHRCVYGSVLSPASWLPKDDIALQNQFLQRSAKTQSGVPESALNEAATANRGSQTAAHPRKGCASVESSNLRRAEARTTAAPIAIKKIGRTKSRSAIHARWSASPQFALTEE